MFFSLDSDLRINLKQAASLRTFSLSRLSHHSIESNSLTHWNPTMCWGADVGSLCGINGSWYQEAYPRQPALGFSKADVFGCQQKWESLFLNFPDKESTFIAGDPGSIPGSGRSPGEGNGHPLQYSCLWNSMDRGAWWATVHGVTKELDTTERLRLEHLYSQFFATTPTPKLFLMNLQSQWSVCGLCSQQQLVFTSMKPLLTLPHSHLPLVLSPSLHQKGRLLRIKTGVYLCITKVGITWCVLNKNVCKLNESSQPCLFGFPGCGRAWSCHFPEREA